MAVDPVPRQPDHGACLPRSEFEDFYDVHAKSIRHEFKKTHDKIDSLAEDMDRKFEKTHEKIDSGFARIDARFAQVDSEFNAVRMTISNLSVIIHNSKISRLHQRIQAIQTFDPSSDLNSIITPRSPEGFPMKVDTFLSISDDISRLTKLCHFYNLDWQSWEDSFDSTSPQTMEEAVQTYSGLAQRDLADKLGLDLDHLDLMKTRLEDFQRSNEVWSGQRKRSQHSEVEAQVIKRQKAQSLDSPPPDKPSDQPRAAKLSSLQQRVSTKELLGETSSPQSPSSKNTSKHTHLDWDPKKLPLRSSTASEKSGSTELL